MKRNELDRSVFINCPFDAEYDELLDAIIFTIHDSGFRPRCVLEIDDGGRTRIERIGKVMAACGSGIHDISRVQLDSTSKLPRFNMPFELGLFMGQDFGRRSSKPCLILDEDLHRYDKMLSDISGHDIRAHAGEVSGVVKCVRDFLQALPGRANAPAASEIQRRFSQFRSEQPKLKDDTFIDRSNAAFSWLEQNASQVKPRTATGKRTVRAVLWVDDYPENNEVYADQLRADGFRITFAQSTAEALAKLSRRPFDFVISDMFRREHEAVVRNAGVRLLREMMAKNFGIPIAIFTGVRGMKYERDARDGGARVVTTSFSDIRRTMNSLRPRRA